MGKLLLFIIVLFELTYAVICVVKKSRYDRVRYIVQIAAFIMFLILCATPLIELSFRWYALGGFLIILALIGVYKYRNEKKITRTFKARNIILSAVGRSIIFFLVLVLALVFPQYTLPETTGKYTVATADYTYMDKIRRDKSGANQYVNVSFWYPENVNETYPLVVFDHGAFGIKDSNYLGGQRTKRY